MNFNTEKWQDKIDLEVCIYKPSQSYFVVGCLACPERGRWVIGCWLKNTNNHLSRNPISKACVG